MGREIDYKKVFKTLGYLVDGSVNYHIHSETRLAFKIMAYKYKEVIYSYAYDSKYFEQDLRAWNECKNDDVYSLYYCPWLNEKEVCDE